MTEKKRFIRDGAMLTAVALLTRSASMLFSAFLARSIGGEGVGLFTLVMTVYSFAFTLATSGIGLATTRAVAASDKAVGIRSALGYSAIFGGSAGLLLLLLAHPISHRLISSPEAAPLLMILALGLLPVSLTTVLSGYFIGVRRVRANAAAQIFAQLFRILLCYLLVERFGGGEVIGSLRLICLSSLITDLSTFALLLLLFFLDKLRHPSQREGASMKEISSVALPLAFSQYVRSLLLSVEHILIPRRLEHGGLTAEESLSGYGILHGMALPTILFPMSPLSSFAGLLVPEFASDQASGRASRMSRLTSAAGSATLTYSIAVSVLVSFFSEELGFAIYGSAEVGLYLRILAPVIPIMYLDHVCDQILKGIGEQVYSMWVNIADSFISIALVFFLLPKMGIAGYALVIILMEAFNFLMSLARLHRRVKIRLSVIHALVLPLALSVLSCYVSGRLFRFSGAAASTPWLICKIFFAICLFVFLDRIVRILLCNINKYKKTPPKN